MSTFAKTPQIRPIRAIATPKVLTHTRMNIFGLRTAIRSGPKADNDGGGEMVF